MEGRVEGRVGGASVATSGSQAYSRDGSGRSRDGSGHGRDFRGRGRGRDEGEMRERLGRGGWAMGGWGGLVVLDCQRGGRLGS